MKVADLNIGDWVLTEDGIGQVLYIRDFYVEEFVEIMPFEDELKKGGLYKTFVGVKLFCNFNGKVKKIFKVDFYHSYSCEKLSKTDSKLLKKSLEENKALYEKYKRYTPKRDVFSYVELSYLIEENKEKVIFEIRNLIKDLSLPFTFKELKKEFEKSTIKLNLNNYLKHGVNASAQSKITFVLYNSSYKVYKKERLFDYLKIC